MYGGGGPVQSPLDLSSVPLPPPPPVPPPPPTPCICNALHEHCALISHTVATAPPPPARVRECRVCVHCTCNPRSGVAINQETCPARQPQAQTGGSRVTASRRQPAAPGLSPCWCVWSVRECKTRTHPPDNKFKRTGRLHPLSRGAAGRQDSS